MKVRVFLPRERDQADGSVFSEADYNFALLPSVGHVLHFTGDLPGEYTVGKVGFVQEGPSFVAAVWLEGVETKSPINSDLDADGGDGAPYRDLNADVPPESMESY